MRIDALNIDQIRALHHERLLKDFPLDELKPIGMIESEIARGEYACYGAIEGDSIVAYAFFVTVNRCALFDYFAVRRDLRNQGIGSRFLQALIQGPLADMDCVLLEIDDPDRAENRRDKAQRLRRQAFYLRNGLIMTGVIVEVYHVFYRILTLPAGISPSDQKIREVYAMLYHSMINENLYKKWIHIPGYSPKAQEAPSD